ncbi:MAG: DNA polymerase III subunit delta [Gammaproteobacteria bacterium]|nr:DNA polymerase III subunit delta [Gammaproteobacteria bacterium]
MAELRPEQLSRALDRGLAAAYLVAGEEPLLIEESLDLIRAQARAAGFTGREVFHVETGFDWQRLTHAADSLSLFSDQRLLELRLPTGRPGKEGAAVLKALAERPAEDTVLLVICGRLEPAQRRAAWVKTLTDHGTTVHAAKLRRDQLERWVENRARERGLKLAPAAARLLAERNEGNLLALSQEIDKLLLLAGDQANQVEQGLDAVREAVADSARYAIFDLPEAVIQGDVLRTQRIVERLRAEGEEAVLVLWGVARELRVLADLQDTQAQRGDTAAVLRRHRVWRNREGQMQALSQRGPTGGWRGLLARAAAVDRIIKGAQPGSAWDELLELSTDAARIAGMTVANRKKA